MRWFLGISCLFGIGIWGTVLWLSLGIPIILMGMLNLMLMMSFTPIFLFIVELDEDKNE